MTTRTDDRTPNRRATAARVAMALGAVALLAGCTGQLREPRPFCDFAPIEEEALAGPSGPALLPKVPGSMTPMPLNAVNIIDPAIINKVIIQDSRARRNETGTAQVWTRIANCIDFPLQVELRTHFLDEGQAPAEEASAWQRVILPPKSIGTYRESSISNVRPAYFYVEMREGS